MLQLILLCSCFVSAFSYFTLPGKCPENVAVQDTFRLADFFGKWHQAFHYSSDGQVLNNCSTLELMTRPTGIYLDQSRVDRGLFHRYSIGKLNIPTSIEDAADLSVTFTFPDAPRRLSTRRYPFKVLATNYNYYATVYTCQYNELTNKHYMYVWVLSRRPTLNEVSKDLALRPLQQIGVNVTALVKADLTKCSSKYYEDRESEPLTFRFPVII